MAEDILETIIAIVIGLVLIAALGPWIADRLWQIEAVRELFTGLVIAIMIAVVIILVLAYLQFSSGGRR